ncbi:pilus assembly protein [Rhizobium sp. ARZ01]|uniref:TadE/TadG family type IV pilus assembly protein n=1 Tax=Rhizobium sp. ARZ01 TaxID=2769313 RepID=UPI00177E8E8C|nr:TadE/TadG family type IV pilus assembly protein [Rhizobium sp. ARZ01]MBD9374295.1 pilus assembly protein [Rhizobium sp. ARZ01]
MTDGVESGRPEKGLLATLLRLKRARNGSAAVELAIVAPLLLFGYIGAYELSVGMTVLNKVGRASATISDMIAQQESVNSTFLTSMNDVAAAVGSPNMTTGTVEKPQNFSLTVTGIAVDDNEKSTVAWSRGWGDEAEAKVPGTDGKLPEDMRKTRSFYVETKLVLPYRVLIFLPSLPGVPKATDVQPIKLTRVTYSRVRKGNDISCNLCMAK